MEFTGHVAWQAEKRYPVFFFSINNKLEMSWCDDLPLKIKKVRPTGLHFAKWLSHFRKTSVIMVPLAAISVIEPSDSPFFISWIGPLTFEYNLRKCHIAESTCTDNNCHIFCTFWATRCTRFVSFKRMADSFFLSTLEKVLWFFLYLQ